MLVTGVQVVFEINTHKFVILNVQEDEFGPEVCALCGLDDLGDVDAGDEKLQVLHDCKSKVRMLLCEVDADLRFSGLYLLYRMESSVKMPIWIPY